MQVFKDGMIPTELTDNNRLLYIIGKSGWNRKEKDGILFFSLQYYEEIFDDNPFTFSVGTELIQQTRYWALIDAMLGVIHHTKCYLWTKQAPNYDKNIPYARQELIADLIKLNSGWL